jgi:hypothetical protein
MTGPEIPNGCLICAGARRFATMFVEEPDRPADPWKFRATMEPSKANLVSSPIEWVSRSCFAAIIHCASIAR